MRHPRHSVLADDLTGAAEIAAIAWQAGMSAVVLTGNLRHPCKAECVVLNTDTRLLTPAVAARKMSAAVRTLAPQTTERCFVKVDSVLRGPVASMLHAAAKTLGRHRILIVNANPSLKRTVSKGCLKIDGVPLHETIFASDPHHPRRTSEVRKLLGPSKEAAPEVRASDDILLPEEGLILGDAATQNDVLRWNKRVDESTLLAGAADFFRAWIGAGKTSRRRAPRIHFDAPVLLLHGSTAAPPSAAALRFNGRSAPAVRVVSEALRQTGAACVAPPARRIEDAADAIAENFGELASSLSKTGAFRHLLIAGGATAARVLPALGWTALEVVRVWAPGVVTLRPLDDPSATVTLKPGSYPWPENLRRALPPHLLT